MDFLVSKAVIPRFTVKAGVMNLFDCNQTEKESPLFFDDTGEYNVVRIWGPLRGREVTVGVQMKFQVFWEQSIPTNGSLRPLVSLVDINVPSVCFLKRLAVGVLARNFDPVNPCRREGVGGLV